VLPVTADENDAHDAPVHVSVVPLAGAVPPPLEIVVFA
jgi:hypothetical protein